MVGAQARRGPVLEPHTEAESVTFKDFLDLGQRLLAKVRCSEKLDFRTLDEITDVHDVLGLEAVRRTYRQLQFVHRAQQDRVDLVLGLCAHALFLTLQVDEDRQLVLEDAARAANCLFRVDSPVGLDVDQQLVEVGTLLDARSLYIVCLLYTSDAADE